MLYPVLASNHLEYSQWFERRLDRGGPLAKAVARSVRWSSGSFARTLPDTPGGLDHGSQQQPMVSANGYRLSRVFSTEPALIAFLDGTQRALGVALVLEHPAADPSDPFLLRTRVQWENAHGAVIAMLEPDGADSEAKLSEALRLFATPFLAWGMAAQGPTVDVRGEVRAGMWDSLARRAVLLWSETNDGEGHLVWVARNVVGSLAAWP